MLHDEGWTRAKVAEEVTTAVTKSFSSRFHDIEKGMEDKVGKMRNALIGVTVWHLGPPGVRVGRG